MHGVHGGTEKNRGWGRGKKRYQERWLYFLDKDTPEKLLEEVINMDAAISKANERLNFVSQDKDFLRTYHLREMAMSDLTTSINTATELGFAKGIEKEKFEVAKKAIAAGSTIDFVCKITGLDTETIKSLY